MILHLSPELSEIIIIIREKVDLRQAPKLDFVDYLIKTSLPFYGR